MAMLEKTSAIHRRNEKGELLPVEGILEKLPDKPTFKFIPITYGKFQELRVQNNQTTKEQDAIIIHEHCVEPSFTKEEALNLKASYGAQIVLEIMKYSLSMTEKDILSGDDKLNKNILAQELQIEKKNNG